MDGTSRGSTHAQNVVPLQSIPAQEASKNKPSKPRRVEGTPREQEVVIIDEDNTIPQPAPISSRPVSVQLGAAQILEECDEALQKLDEEEETLG